VFFTSIRAEASEINKEFPPSGFKMGDALRVGVIEIVGEVFTVGELLGLNDGARCGCIEGRVEVDGDCEEPIEGELVGSVDGWLEG